MARRLSGCTKTVTAEQTGSRPALAHALIYGFIFHLMRGLTLGQAAGTAAALALRRGVPPRAVDPRELRELLVRDGVDLRRPAHAR